MRELRGCYSIGQVYFSARNHLRRSSVWCRRGIIENDMPYVITEACKNTKDRACVDVCPVDCIYEGPDQLYIHPDECIDCGACEPECPVTAIFPEEDVPANLKEYVQINREVFKSEAPPGRPNR
jgi:ferredoxin